MIYQVRRVDDDTELTADWNSPAWGPAEPLDIRHHMGEAPHHRLASAPHTTKDD